MKKQIRSLELTDIFETVEFPDAYKVSYLANAIVIPSYEDVRRDFGMVRAEYHLLLCLAHYAELTAQDIARMTRRPRNSISRAVHRMLKEGYIKSDFSNKLNEFEEKTSEHIEIDESSKITKVNYKNRKLAGLIEVMKHKNIYVVLNGHHRIAIMKSFLDNNIIKDKKILVKFEKSYFFEKVYLKIISILK